MVTIFDQNIAGVIFTAQVAEDHAVGGLVGNGDTSFFPAGLAVEFDQEALGAENDLFVPVMVPVEDLAGNVMMSVFTADPRFAPTP